MGRPKPKTKTSTIRNRKFMDKSKSTGNFVAFKQKKTGCEKTRRASQRMQALRQCRGRKQQLTERKPKITSLSEKVRNARPTFVENRNEAARNDDEATSSSHCSCEICDQIPAAANIDNAFDTEEELAEAVAKMERALPSSPRMRKAVIKELFRSLDEETQQEIIAHWTAEELREIHRFYHRDDISRLLLVNEPTTVVDGSTDQTEPVRQLICTLKQAYALYISEKTGTTTTLAKFCSSRPPHVTLCGNQTAVRMLQMDLNSQ